MAFLTFATTNESIMSEVNNIVPENGETPKAKKKIGLGARNEDYGCTHLKFLIDLFNALGLTPNSYAKMTDNPTSTAVGLRYQLNKDDMKVRKAKEIVASLGFELQIRFVDDKVQESDPSYMVKLPECLKQKKQSKYKDLAFLDEFMQERKISRRGLAEAISLSPGAVQTWFMLDNMSIKYLDKIKDAYNMKLEFSILPVQ